MLEHLEDFVLENMYVRIVCVCLFIVQDNSKPFSYLGIIRNDELNKGHFRISISLLWNQVKIKKEELFIFLYGNVTMKY